MSITSDYLVVGSGLTGATIARHLHDAGREVLVIDRRLHAGGNVYDVLHAPSGIRVHAYGPHYFRTSSEKVWRYVNRFATWYPWAAEVRTIVDHEIVPWPPNQESLQRFSKGQWAPAETPRPAANLEEQALSMMARPFYERFVKEYNEKQWGCPCTELTPKLCRRFEVRLDGERRLTPHARWQGLPSEGYQSLMDAMLSGIPTILNTEFDRGVHLARKCLIFTGPVDAYFGFDEGRLHYRAQRREHAYRPEVTASVLPCVQVNNPQHAHGPHIRTIEWRHMAPEGAVLRGSFLTRETPYTPTDPNEYEYPSMRLQDQPLIERYRARATSLSNVIICGRLGEARYLDMDQAIARAMLIAERLLTS